MDLSPKTTTVTTQDEKRWLGTDHGTDCMETITLDVTNGGFTVVDGGDGWGYIKSGEPLKKDGATALYKRALSTEACDGHLFESVRVKTGTGATTKAGASLYWHGKVIAAQVPGAFVTAQRAAANIRYV
jgi:hypothetical protein